MILVHIFFRLDSSRTLDRQKNEDMCPHCPWFVSVINTDFHICHISAFGLHWGKKHANEADSILVDELDGKELVENRDIVLEKRGEKNHESAKIKTRKVGGRVRFIDRRELKIRLKANKKLRMRKKVELKEKNKDRTLGRKKENRRKKKCKEQSRKDKIAQMKKKPRQPNSTESNVTSQYLECSSKYKEYGLLALTKAATLVKQVI